MTDRKQKALEMLGGGLKPADVEPVIDACVLFDAVPSEENARAMMQTLLKVIAGEMVRQAITKAIEELPDTPAEPAP